MQTDDKAALSSRTEGWVMVPRDVLEQRVRDMRDDSAATGKGE